MILLLPIIHLSAAAQLLRECWKIYSDAWASRAPTPLVGMSVCWSVTPSFKFLLCWCLWSWTLAEHLIWGPWDVISFWKLWPRAILWLVLEVSKQRRMPRLTLIGVSLILSYDAVGVDMDYMMSYIFGLRIFLVLFIHFCRKLWSINFTTDSFSQLNFLSTRTQSRSAGFRLEAVLPHNSTQPSLARLVPPSHQVQS